MSYLFCCCFHEDRLISYAKAFGNITPALNYPELNGEPLIKLYYFGEKVHIWCAEINTPETYLGQVTLIINLTLSNIVTKFVYFFFFTFRSFVLML